MNNLEIKIEKKLTDYIGFDIKHIINDELDRLYVFGGAIRDIISDRVINDIDILCMSDTMIKTESILKLNGYKLNEKNGNVDFSKIYDIHIIHEPHNWTKIIDGNLKTIQLIRPVKNININKNELLEYTLGQVDMSNCAVHYSHKYGLKESYFNAIKYCKIGVFNILNTEMKTDRIYKREFKFLNRGWLKIDNDNIKKINRKIKLLEIMDDDYNQNFFMQPPTKNENDTKTKTNVYIDYLKNLL